MNDSAATQTAANETNVPTRCGCVQRMNEALRDTYPGVRLLVDINGHMPVIATYYPAGKRKAPIIIPTYCPFCGIKYRD